MQQHRAFAVVAPPLEAAFLDTATVKRTFVARGARLAGSN